MKEASALKELQLLLGKLNIAMRASGHILQLEHAHKNIACHLIREQVHAPSTSTLNFPYDVFIRRADLLAAAIQSQFQLNQRVFARTCEVRKLTKPIAAEFLNAHHVMGAVGSVSQYGLFKNEDLLAVATFSNGRKMRRLPEHLRSFELIRFCNKSGVTVSGGLTKLLQHFIREKNPGDIMTYVDAGYSSGEAYLKAGFEKKEKSEGVDYLVDTQSFERFEFDLEKAKNVKRYYIYQQQGNLKLVYNVIANN